MVAISVHFEQMIDNFISVIYRHIYIYSLIAVLMLHDTSIFIFSLQALERGGRRDTTRSSQVTSFKIRLQTWSFQRATSDVGIRLAKLQTQSEDNYFFM